MLGRTKAKLSLMFNRKAVTTHRFEQNTFTRVGDEFTGRYKYSIPSKSKIWAEATPISKDCYAVTVKQLDTHNGGWLGISSGSVLEKTGRNGKVDGKNTTIFTRDQAIQMLKLLEKEFEKGGYVPSGKQSFKKRIYTEKKATTPKAS